MSNFDGTITSDPAWVDIPRLSTTCQALGGPGGPMNAQATAIAARLGFLADAIAAINAGAQLYTGSGAPADTLGDNGDLYIDPAAGMLYGPKAAGSWAAGTSLAGPPGAVGPAGGFTNVVSFEAAGSTNWVVPAGVYKIMVEAWGGGQGGAKQGNSASKGGDGGSYGKALLNVTPGDTIVVLIGAGGLGVQYPGPDSTTGAPGGRTSVAKLGGGYGLVQNSIGQDPFAVSGGTLVESILGERMPGAALYEKGGSAPNGGFGGTQFSTTAGFPGGGGWGSSSSSTSGQAGARGKALIWY